MSSPSPANVCDHFVILVYPFQHRFEGHTNSPYHTLDARWRPWWSRLLSPNDSTPDELARAIDDTYFFLPHVRRMLHPETHLLPGGELCEQLPKAVEIANESPSEVVHRLGSQIQRNCFLRLTLSKRQMHFFRVMRFHAPGAGRRFTVNAETDWIDLILGPQQVGLLTWKLRLRGEALLTHDRLSEFLCWFRQIYSPSIELNVASWDCGTTRRLTNRDLMDFLLQGVCEANEKIDDSLHHFIARGHDTQQKEIRYTSTPFAQVYGETCNLYTYAEVDCDDTSDPKFSQVNDRRLYEIATATDTSNENLEPSDGFAKELLKNNWIDLWVNWRGVALQDSVVFAGLADSSRQRSFEVLKRNVDAIYFQIYFLALSQKVWMNRFFEKMVRLEQSIPRSHYRVQSIWEEFVAFDNCLWYLEVTRRTQGTELFNAFKLGLRSEKMYEELKSQMDTLREFYDSRVSQGTASLLTLIAVIGIPVSVSTGLFGGKVVDDSATYLPIFFAWNAFLIVAFVILSLVWQRCVTRWHGFVRDLSRQDDHTGDNLK